MNLGRNIKLNFFAEFEDKYLEADYLQNYVESSKKITCILVSTIGALFFLTVFVDMVTVGDQDTFILNIITRSTVLIVTIFTSIFMMKSKHIKKVLICSMLFSIITIIGYQCILFLYSGQDFMQQSLAYLLIVYAIFLLPNRWIYAFFFNIGIVIMFFLITSISIKNTTFHQEINVFICLISGVILGATSSYALNRSRRLQFFREQQLEILSVTDHLTSAYNRQKFDQVFFELLEVINTKKEYFSIIMFDFDNFKNFNDTHGHIMGDKILKSCVNVIHDNIKKQDILTRWGGEEFIVLLPNTTLIAATTVAEKLRKYIEHARIENDLSITASFGVTRITEEDTIDTAVTRADSYLYKAKHSGKNCIFAE